MRTMFVIACVLLCACGPPAPGPDAGTTDAHAHQLHVDLGLPDAWYSRVAYDAVGGLTVTASRYINGFQVESDEAYDGCWLVPFAGPRGPVTWTCNDFRIECSDRGAVLEAHGLRDGSGSAEFTADDMDFSFRDQVSVIECY